MIKFLSLVFNQKTALVLILILGLYLRTLKIDNQIADWHSWRQADTAAVARNFYQEGFNMLMPRGDDMSVISDSGKPNLERLRLVEFPVYPALIYFGYLLNGGVNEVYARAVSVIFSLGSIVFVYL